MRGIVQGVGFRPTVARLATELGLGGHVENTSHGVEILLQGHAEALGAFEARLLAAPPPMATIFALEGRDVAPDPAVTGFAIRASRIDPVASAVIPPDIATCPRCRAEIADPADRRFGYPFTNCTDCGPRFTIIESIPYDRERTAMAGFPPCPACAAEYGDPAGRRFHAQPNACPACGPRLTLLGPAGEPRPGDPLAGAARCLVGGGILALLGLGGFHLACDAAEEAAVVRLRQRKARPAKPLAVMVADLAAAALVHLDPGDGALLAGPRAPILLLPARAGAPVAPSVAPGQDRLGVFLPYTPLHHLLLAATGLAALVMTSGNRSDEPILATWEEARGKLSGVADAFLLHDRPILHRVDDSVVKPLGARGPVVLRRARGYAPAPVALANPRGRTVLALGGELANAPAVARGPFAYLAPHVGDLTNLEAEAAHLAAVEHLLRLLRVEPDLVACDLHPRYATTRLAQGWAARGVPVVRVQHHEAHLAGCMAEHGFVGDALGLALDGLGYGTDQTLWGGELLAGRPGAFRRLGHLPPVPQPGGDRAAREPWRMAASHLRRLRGPGWRTLPLAAFRARAPGELDGLEAMMDRGINAPVTSSCGRLFDAAAAILGFAGSALYSAHAPMEFEALAARCSGDPPAYPWREPTRVGETLRMDPGDLLEALLADALGGRDPGMAALAFHRGLAGLLAAGAAAASAQTGLRTVFLTGGCLQNAPLATALAAELEARGLEPRLHREVPPNDGGIAYGQAAWVLGTIDPPGRELLSSGVF